MTTTTKTKTTTTGKDETSKRNKDDDNKEEPNENSKDEDDHPKSGVAGSKKKKAVVVPECPAAVATGYLFVRAAVQAVVGADGLCSLAGGAAAAAAAPAVSLMQPTYVKDAPAATGKFSWNLGKKLGTACQLDLPDGDDEPGREELLAAIQTVANRLLLRQQQQDLDITCFSCTKGELLIKFGAGVLDGSHANHKKCPADKVLTAAYLRDWCLAVLPARPYRSCLAAVKAGMRAIEFDFQQCHVSAGKKARKAEIGIKFRVVIDDNETTATASSEDDTLLATVTESRSLTADDVSFLGRAEIRCDEGRALLLKQQREAAAETATTTTTPEAATTTTTDGAAGPAETAAAATSSGEAAANDDNGDDDDEEEMEVTAWVVKGNIDYTKLTEQFGSQLIAPELLEQLRAIATPRVGPKLHRFLRRGMFFSHRDLDALLRQLQSGGGSVYLYTGRGPSSESMHLGHLIPFLFTKWLQDALGCPLVIQMTDDEKFLFKGKYDDVAGDYNLDEYRRLTVENARDIIACGFDYGRTFLFSDVEYVGRMYPNICRIWKACTVNAVNGIFGFDGSSCCGQVAFPAVQAAPSFATSFPVVLDAADRRACDRMCLIPCAIDQDPYFRMTRDVAGKMAGGRHHPLAGKPALVHSKFFPALQGSGGKMSSSDPNSAVFLTDTAEQIAAKIRQHAFSGGRDTRAEQQRLGANLNVDVPYQWLRFFLEDDDELEQIETEYGSGSGKYWSTAAVKNRLIEVLQELVADHQARRANITDDEVRKWMTERSIVG